MPRAATLNSVRWVVAVAAITICGTGCAWSGFGGSGSDDAFVQPEEVPDGMVCDEWVELPDSIRLDYALFRLSELRGDDGITTPPTEAQGSEMRKHMEAQCGQATMQVAAVWRVAHDQYVRAFERGIFLD